MADSVREAALKALLTVLSGISGPLVLRNADESQTIPSGGLVVLRDGEPGEPEVTLSPTRYWFDHRAEVIVQVQDEPSAARDGAMDVLLQTIGATLNADQTLSGAVDNLTIGTPEIMQEPVEGGETVKAVLVPVYLEYDALTPLG